MSLHKFAEQVAAHGRGDDSLLVHMTPDEVQRLQAFAEANGTTMTINPETGLPEAGFLSDLFKAVAPIALGAFLGPAGFGLSAGMAGVATGGITALATGSLSRGLMAGLGAYGGAGLGESLMGAGGNALVAGGAPIGAENVAGAAVPPIEQVNPSNFNLSAADKFSAGAKAVTASPGAALDFAKGNLGNLGYAAAPIMAGAMVPTTTKLPDTAGTGYIRQMDFNINPDTGKPDPLYGIREMTPIKASEFKDKTFQGQRELFRQQNPNPYEIGVASLNRPPQQATPMASGGIVALAGGGVPGYAAGALVSDQQIFDYFKNPTPGRTDAQIAADMQTFNVSAADIARATGTQGQQADYEKRFVQALNPATLNSADFMAKTADVGLKDQALVNAMQNAGLSKSAQYAATHSLNDAAGLGPEHAAGKAFYDAYGYKAGDAPGDQGGIAGLYANIDYAADRLQDQINAGKLTVEQAQNLSLAEIERLGISQADIKNATGSDFANLFKAKKADDKITGGDTTGGDTTGDKVVDKTCGTGYHWDEATQSCVKNDDATQRTTTTVTKPTDIATADSTALAVGVGGGGITTVNPNGTITTRPNIPGIPEGGFTGMESLRDAYTRGGGSLGYTATAPRTIAEFNQLYNRQTGDSLAAYNYLVGKGANNNAYPTRSSVSQLAVPYAEYALGKKAKRPAVTTKTTVAGTPGQPQTYFNEAEYLAANPDVAAELRTGKSVSGQPTKFTSGYEHWLLYGKAAGRPFTGDYQGYTTAAALADAASATQQNAGGDGNAAPPGPDASSPANSDAGTTTAKDGGMMGYAMGGGLGSLGSYSDGGRLLKGPGDGVSDSIPATIGRKQQPARLADGEFVIPARIVSELGNGSTDAGAKKLYAMMDRVQRARGKTTGKNKVAANSRADKYLPA